MSESTASVDIMSRPLAASRRADTIPVDMLTSWLTPKPEKPTPEAAVPASVVKEQTAPSEHEISAEQDINLLSQPDEPSTEPVDEVDATTHQPEVLSPEPNEQLEEPQVKPEEPVPEPTEENPQKQERSTPEPEQQVASEVPREKKANVRTRRNFRKTLTRRVLPTMAALAGITGGAMATGVIQPQEQTVGEFHATTAVQAPNLEKTTKPVALTSHTESEVSNPMALAETLAKTPEVSSEITTDDLTKARNNINLYIDTSGGKPFYKEGKGALLLSKRAIFGWGAVAGMSVATTHEAIFGDRQGLPDAHTIAQKYYYQDATHPAGYYPRPDAWKALDYEWYSDDTNWTLTQELTTANQLFAQGKNTEATAIIEQQRKVFYSLYEQAWDKKKGGIFWVYQHEHMPAKVANPQTKVVIEQGQFVQNAILLSQYEQDGSEKQKYYLEAAKKVYDWAVTNLQDPQTKRFWNSIGNTVGPDLDPSFYSYSDGAMIGAGVRLYEATEDTTYLKNAEETAQAYLKAEGDKPPRPFIFATVTNRNLLRLYIETQNPLLRKAIRNKVISDANSIRNDPNYYDKATGKYVWKHADNIKQDALPGYEETPTQGQLATTEHFALAQLAEMLGNGDIPDDIKRAMVKKLS